jgi:hypothetical protein
LFRLSDEFELQKFGSLAQTGSRQIVAASISSINHICLLMRDAFDNYSAAVASCAIDFKAWPESKLCAEFAAI